MGIIALFHAVFQVCHANSHIRYRHVNMHRCVYVHTPYGWVERSCCFIIQVVSGQTACVQQFFTPCFSSSTSPHSSFLLCCLSNHCVFTYIYLLLQSPQTSIHISSRFLFFLSSCRLICVFFSFFLFSAYVSFYGACHGSLIISASYIFIYRLPLLRCNGAIGLLH